MIEEIANDILSNLHPITVHFPIALLTVSVLFEVLSAFTNVSSFKITAKWTFLTGYVSLLLVLGTGLLAVNGPYANFNEKSAELLTYHKAAAFISISLFGVLLLWRFFNRLEVPEKKSSLMIYLLVSILSVSVMSFGGHTGGLMVYKHAVGIHPQDSEVELE
ncbi:MAG: DUF2231 domain-containing protein [Candidatus Delongbacteria bacterium]|nr:DUF2231 domain-containing protein [Candidatus Delongbacteria bacterium]MBN2835939.1 DUF2231 domain-containing protein [Candidatus Delongbacteria bacterium]